MLDPQRARVRLFEVLRPPRGYQLDYAIGTTYTLDLLAMLLAPVAFVSFACDLDPAAPDPVALLHALQAYARRLTIFCQAGHITVPASQQTVLNAYLESSLVEVLPPADGTFHPKVWALRFTAEDQPVRYRLLCMSRNLTLDRCWDTVLTLDGVLTDRQNAFSANHPLGNFFAALPNMAKYAVADYVRQRVDQIQGELRRVRFTPPDGFEHEIRFWPLGLDQKPVWPFKKCDRILAISPFVTAGTLAKLAKLANREAILVSRLEEMQALGVNALQPYARCYQLSPYANPEEADSHTADDDTQEKASPPAVQLTGLHAKCYVADHGWDTHIWTGSANATMAAFERNVEFLVELKGKRSRCGIDTLLTPREGEMRLVNMLELYSPGAATIEIDTEATAREQLLEDARRLLARTPMRAVVDATSPGHYDIRLTGKPLELPTGVRVTCRPSTLPAAAAAATDLGIGGGAEDYVRFTALPTALVTAFFVFTLSLTDGDEQLAFVLALPVEGIPTNREQRILQNILASPALVARMLFFLLRSEHRPDLGELFSIFDATAAPQGLSSRTASNTFAGLPLLEAMTRTLGEQPERLEHVRTMVDALRSNDPQASDLLPAGFDAIWAPIWEAYTRIRHAHTD